MSRFLRYLRTAFSAFCGIACVLLVVLWVASHWQAYEVWGSVGTLNYAGMAHRGQQIGTVFRDIPAEEGVRFSFDTEGSQEVEADWGLWVPWQTGALGFDIFDMPLDNTKAMLVKVPSWFSVLLFGTLAAAPWLRWRFSLRTLLIAATLVAVVLGTIVYLAH